MKNPIFKLYLIALFLFTTAQFNTFAQKGAKAEWARFSCGYSDGSTIYEGNLNTTSSCTDKQGHIYNIGNLTGKYFTLDTSIVNITLSKIFINKFNSNGKRIWTKTVETTNPNIELSISKITSDESGNLLICGIAKTAFDSIYFAPNWYKINNGFIAKFDSNWVNLWCTTIDGDINNPSIVNFTDIVAQPYIYACGNASSGKFTIKPNPKSYYSPKSSNGFLLTLNPYNGKLMNSLLLDTNSINRVNSIIVSKRLNCYITGEIISSDKNYFKFNSDSLEIKKNAKNSFVIRMVNVFRYHWMKMSYTYLNKNAINGNYSNSLTHIEIDKDENVYVMGNCNGDSTTINGQKIVNQIGLNTNYMQDIYLIKFDAYGELKYIKNFGTNGSDFVTDFICDDEGNSIIAVGSDNNGNSGYIFGNDTIRQNHGGLIKLNPNGDIIFIKELQNSKYPKSLTFGDDSSFYVTGSDLQFNSNYSTIPINNCENPKGVPSNFNMYLVKFNEKSSNNSSINTNLKIPTITIFPNPVVNELNIQSLDIKYKEATINIYNSMGNLCNKEIIPFQHSNQLDFTNFPSGTYLIRISTESENLTFKIIKF